MIDRWRHQIQVLFLMMLFLWNYLILLMSDWSVLQTLKIIFNIISKSESKFSHLGIYPWSLNSANHFSIFSFNFISDMLVFPYLEIHTGSWKQHPKYDHQQWAPSPFVFKTFPDFIAVFHLLLNIITNSGHHPLFLPVKIHLFYCYFFFAKVPISIFRSAHCTLETAPDVVTNSMHHYRAHQCTLAPCPGDCNRCKKMRSFQLSHPLPTDY